MWLPIIPVKIVALFVLFIWSFKLPDKAFLFLVTNMVRNFLGLTIISFSFNRLIVLWVSFVRSLIRSSVLVTDVWSGYGQIRGYFWEFQWTVYLFPYLTGCREENYYNYGCSKLICRFLFPSTILDLHCLVPSHLACCQAHVVG